MQRLPWPRWLLIGVLCAPGAARAEERPACVDAEACIPDPERGGAGFRAPWQEQGLARVAWVESGAPFLATLLANAALDVEGPVHAPAATSPSMPWPGAGLVVDMAASALGLPATPPPGATGESATATTPMVPATAVLADLQKLRAAVSDPVGAIYTRGVPRSDASVADLDEVSTFVSVLDPAGTSAHADDLDLDDAELERLASYAFDMWAGAAAREREDPRHHRERQKQLDAEITNLERAAAAATTEEQRASLRLELADLRKRLQDVQQAMRAVVGR